MINNLTQNLYFKTYQKQNNRILVFLFILGLLTTFLSTSSFAQTFPPQTNCTSKDLELISATLPAPDKYPCQCDGTRPLILGIRNKTGSTRTAFALWGTLKRYNAAGTLIESKPIFACASTIKASQDNYLQASSGTTQIQVNCGESLEIVDLYLAWTTSNDKETCDFLVKNSATINPKCGVLPKIKIGLGVTADFAVTDATCKKDGTTSGAIKVYPSGGKAPYKVKIGNDERINIPAKDSTSFTLAPGNYDVLITDSSGCTKTLSRTISSPGAVTFNITSGSFTKNCIQNKTGNTIGETMVSGYSYAWTPSTGLSSTSIGTPLANPAATTTYSLTKTDNATGCTAQTSVTVTVDETAPSISAGNPFTITCADNKNGATIGEDAQTGYTYAWSPATGLDDDKKAKPWAKPSATNTYTLTKTNSSNGCAAQANVKVTVNNDPVGINGIGGDFTKTCIQNPDGNTIGETPVNGYSYSWSPAATLSDGTIGNPKANPGATTTYTVTKTNTTTGCAALANVTVTVDNTAVDVTGIGGTFTKTCVQNKDGKTIGETPVNGYSYSWSSATGLSNTLIGNPIANPSTTTTYTVTKTNTTTGCVKTAAVIVTVDNAPVNVSAGNGFTKTCTSNATGANIGEATQTGYSYTWQPATGLSSATVSNPMANPSATATYTVTKTNTTTGCFNTASVTVAVDNAAVDVSGIGGAFTKTCIANTNGNTIGEAAQNGYTYSWSSSPSGFSSTSANPTVNPTATTTYTVRKTKTSSGCATNTSVTVTVNTTPVTVSAGIAFTKTCIQNTTGATIGETPVSGFSYSWSPATGLSDDKIGNPKANPNATATYTVTKTNNSTGCSQQSSVTVTVDNTIPTFTVCLVQPTLCANTGGVTFTANGGSGFEYSIDNGAHYQSSNSFTGLSSGSVTGFLVRNSSGCVSPTTNCNTTSQCESLTSAPAMAAQQQTEIQAEELTVKAYPNPFNSRVRFEVNAKEAGNGSLEVYNTLGQKVKTVYRGFMKSGIQTFELNVPANHHSTLIYQFKMGNKQVTGKLVSAGN